LLVLALLAATAAPAEAAAPLVPRVTQQQVKFLLTSLGSLDLAYMPTAAPPHYSLSTYGAGADAVTFAITDSRYSAQQERGVYFTFFHYQGTAADCQSGRVLTLSSKKIYFDRPDDAWRCVLAKDGKLVMLRAQARYVKGSALGRLVAAVARIR
jgi:hypothetical protein